MRLAYTGGSITTLPSYKRYRLYSKHTCATPNVWIGWSKQTIWLVWFITLWEGYFHFRENKSSVPKIPFASSIFVSDLALCPRPLDEFACPQKWNPSVFMRRLHLDCLQPFDFMRKNHLGIDERIVCLSLISLFVCLFLFYTVWGGNLFRKFESVVKSFLRVPQAIGPILQLLCCPSKQWLACGTLIKHFWQVVTPDCKTLLFINLLLNVKNW